MFDTKQTVNYPATIIQEGSTRLKTVTQISLCWLENRVNQEIETLKKDGNEIQKIAIIVSLTAYQAIIFYKRK